MAKCPKHPDAELVCPKCLGMKGGKKRARTVSKRKLREWGKKGAKRRWPK